MTMALIHRVDRWFVTRVTLIVGVPISLLFWLAEPAGGPPAGKAPLEVVVLYIFGLSLCFALLVWRFLEWPRRREALAKGVESETVGEPPIAFQYLANFLEGDARRVERAFVVRGLRELWLWETVLPIAGALVAIAVLELLDARGLLALLLAIGAGVLAISPLYVTVVRPALAARFARRTPKREITLMSSALSVRVDGVDMTYPWDLLRDVWDLGEHYVVVGDRHIGVHLPKNGLPRGAIEFARARIAAHHERISNV